MQAKPGLKESKTAPTSANMVKLFEGNGVVVSWKGRAKPRRRGAKKASRPRPKPWASLVVFFADPTRRKRSYHLSWNGERYSDGLETRMLWEREPAIAAFVESQLYTLNWKLIKGWDN